MRSALTWPSPQAVHQQLTSSRHQVALARGRTVQLTGERENVMRNSRDSLTSPSR